MMSNSSPRSLSGRLRLEMELTPYQSVSRCPKGPQCGEAAFWPSAASLGYPVYNEFILWLSITDVMLFNPTNAIRECIESNSELN